MAAIRMHALSKRFGQAQVIPPLDLEIRDREFVVFVGPSGCGKSTLLRIIAGLETMDGGQLYIGGRCMNGVPAAQRDIAMVFQDYALYPHMTVRANMAFGLEMRNTPRAEIARRVEHAAALLRIAACLERKPAALSGGQRQRVAMGRAMVRNPQVFLFDEPLSNLDAKLRAQVRTEIKALAQQLQTTMVFVTHDQVEAMTMADRIVVLDAGVVQQFGTPEQVYKAPANQFVAGFMGSPAMNFFAVSARDGALRLADGSRLPLPAHCAAPAGPALLGVRPEHLQLLPDAAPGLRAQVTVVEPLGCDTLVHFGHCGRQHVLRAAPDSLLRPQQAITVGLELDKCHLFDSSGASLARSLVS